MNHYGGGLSLGLLVAIFVVVLLLLFGVRLG